MRGLQLPGVLQGFEEELLEPRYLRCSPVVIPKLGHEHLAAHGQSATIVLERIVSLVERAKMSGSGELRFELLEVRPTLGIYVKGVGAVLLQDVRPTSTWSGAFEGRPQDLHRVFDAAGVGGLRVRPQIGQDLILRHQTSTFEVQVHQERFRAAARTVCVDDHLLTDLDPHTSTQIQAQWGRHARSGAADQALDAHRQLVRVDWLENEVVRMAGQHVVSGRCEQRDDRYATVARRGDRLEWFERSTHQRGGGAVVRQNEGATVGSHATGA